MILSSKLNRTLRYYFNAKQVVVDAGYGHEIVWQDTAALCDVNVQIFYSEYAWVVLSSGMRESVIKRKYLELSELFEVWQDPNKIIKSKNTYRRKALSIFNHKGKIDALIWMAQHLSDVNVNEEINTIKVEGIEYLCTYPYLGNATSLHFAKNIGFIVAKPDRHLIRISDYLGYSSPEQLCKIVSNTIGEKESIIDLILWRYATLTKSYLKT